MFSQGYEWDLQTTWSLGVSIGHDEWMRCMWKMMKWISSHYVFYGDREGLLIRLSGTLFAVLSKIMRALGQSEAPHVYPWLCMPGLVFA